MYVLEQDAAGYDAGTPLVDVPLREARAMECNRCGGCCSGLSDDVVKDEATGLPKFVWGSRFPEDRYESRYGQPLLIPIVMGDGGPRFGEEFERDADGKPHTSFSCTFFDKGDGCTTSCTLRGHENPRDLSTVRPRACGEFPIFGLDVDATILEHGYYVPHTGALPRCTWYGMRITGPWKDEPFWEDRFEQQQAGTAEPMVRQDNETYRAFIRGLEAKARG